MGMTLTDTVNYSGILYAKTDERTRFLDAVYARGKNGGRVTTYSTEFVLSSGYEMEEGSQPEISEQASTTAPAAETTNRSQETNVVQIFQKQASISYSKMSNYNALGGVNIAGAQNNVRNELDFQMSRRIAQIKIDLNYTVLNGVYQYTKGSTTVAPKTRGLIKGISENIFDGGASSLSSTMISDVLKNSIANGAAVEMFEVWVNPDDLGSITKIYSALPGTTQPATRTEGGLAYSRITTSFGVLDIHYDPTIPQGNILFVNMSEMAVAEKPYSNDKGEMIGALFAEPLAKKGASEDWQLYGEFGCDYGAEWHHALLKNFTAP